jgi:hypothetical protein
MDIRVAVVETLAFAATSQRWEAAAATATPDEAHAAGELLRDTIETIEKQVAGDVDRLVEIAANNPDIRDRDPVGFERLVRRASYGDCVRIMEGWSR